MTDYTTYIAQLQDWQHGLIIGAILCAFVFSLSFMFRRLF